ncbi:MAG: NAD(+)--rifampin ADP-ribosyltransferase, partial [Anaerotignum sp.]
MHIDFSPSNEIVKICMRGIPYLEKNENVDEAEKIFLEALEKTSNDFEKYLVSYFIARSKTDINEKLEWFEKTFQIATTIDDVAVKSAIPLLYNHFSYCYAKLQDDKNCEKYHKLYKESDVLAGETGPFYHGTKAELKIGDLLLANEYSNYKENLQMN